MKSDPNRLSAVIFEENNMRTVTKWYRAGDLRPWEHLVIQLEIRDTDAMGESRWHEMGDDIRSSPSNDHNRWLYYVLINRAEKWLKENPR